MSSTITKTSCPYPSPIPFHPTSTQLTPTQRYENLGITGNRATLVTGIYNVVGPLANLIFITFFLDRVGRKKPLLFGASAITVALVCEAALNSQNLDGTRTGYSIGGVFFLFCVTCIFSASFGSISWVYMSEVMPMQIRGKGNAFATGVGNWVVSTIWSQVSPIALDRMGWKFYFIFAAFSMSCPPFQPTRPCFLCDLS